MMTKDGPLAVVLLAVASGAAIGACLRWALSYWLNARWGVMPLGILAANWLGAFAIGMTTAWLLSHQDVTPVLRLFLVTGLMGGLTTFSTFSAESLALLNTGAYARALLHTGMHLFGSILLCAAGMQAFRLFNSLGSS